MIRITLTEDEASYVAIALNFQLDHDTNDNVFQPPAAAGTSALNKPAVTCSCKAYLAKQK